MNKFSNYMGGGEILGVGGGVEDEEDEEPLFQVSYEEGETLIQKSQDEMHPDGRGSGGGGSNGGGCSEGWGGVRGVCGGDGGVADKEEQPLFQVSDGDEQSLFQVSDNEEEPLFQVTGGWLTPDEMSPAEELEELEEVDVVCIEQVLDSWNKRMAVNKVDVMEFAEVVEVVEVERKGVEKVEVWPRAANTGWLMRLGRRTTRTHNQFVEPMGGGYAMDGTKLWVEEIEAAELERNVRWWCLLLLKSWRW